MTRYRTIKILTATYRRARIVAAFTGEGLAALFDRLVNAEFEQRGLTDEPGEGDDSKQDEELDRSDQP